MTGEEARLAGRVVFVTSTGTNCALDAADVGDELVFSQNGGEAVEPFKNGEHRATEKDDVGLRGGGERVVGDDGDGFAAKRDVELIGVGVPACDGALESMRAHRETDGGSDEAGAEDGDALDCHI